ncbi:hspbap1 [Symbiodinium sp. CCMP2592]|nr:hspbap1 [Symbiodinium sp. CCMP2592]
MPFESQGLHLAIAALGQSAGSDTAPWLVQSSAKQALKKELDARIRELSHGLLSVPVPAAFEGMEIHWSRCELARVPRCRPWNFTVQSLTAEPWLARGAKNTLGGNWPCLCACMDRANANVFLVSGWLISVPGSVARRGLRERKVEKSPGCALASFQDVASIPFPQASSWGALLRPRLSDFVIAVISTLRLEGGCWALPVQGDESGDENEGALQRPERLQSRFCRFQSAADTGLTMAEAPAAAGDDDQLDEKALAALIKATGGRRGSTGQKKQICADCGGVITTLLLSGGEYADGCDACWKANGFEGDPPCNIKKSQFQQKAQKQMEKAQRRRDQKTPAEVQAEKLQLARQEKLEELKAKSPLKQALVSLIQHIEEQSLSELELFHEIDQNGDGILTRGEMAAALRRLGCPLSPSELDGVLRCFDADNSGSIDFAEFYQLLREESHWIEQREVTKEDPRLCGFAIGDRVRLKCRLFSDLSKASLLKDDFQVTAGKVMGPGKKQGIITIDLDKGGGEMTVKAELLQKLTATKGHHHGCLCEVCFIECYGTDYFGYPPDDEENPYEPHSPRSAQSPSGGMSPMSAGRSGFSPGSSPRSPASPVRKTFPRQCHQDAYGQNLVAQIAGEKLWLLFPPSSTWLGPHRLPYEDSSTFTDVDPFVQLPPGCTGVGVILKPGDVLAVPRHWFHAVECLSEGWSLSVNQWLDAAGDEEQRVHEAVARCLATPLVEARPKKWWLNPDEELLETSENIDFLASALQVASDDHQDLPVEAVQAALLRAATHPEVVSLIVRRVKEDLCQGPSIKKLRARSRRQPGDSQS